MRILKRLLVAIAVFVLLPLGAQAVIWSMDDRPASWRTADWSSADILPPASANPEAFVAIYTARTGRWKGIFAVHSWIVVKPANAPRYRRFDVVGWGRPVRVNAYAPDARWYSNEPELLRAIKGPTAETLIPKIEAAVKAYPFSMRGDYRIWPGPNSNTFVAAILAAVPEIGVTLPPTAIGKDYPIDGRIFGAVPSGAGFRVNLGGVVGVTAGSVEGFEVNILGAVAGLDFSRPGIKLPGLGRIGL